MFVHWFRTYLVSSSPTFRQEFSRFKSNTSAMNDYEEGSCVLLAGRVK
jgi:hypothetical protein